MLNDFYLLVYLKKYISRKWMPGVKKYQGQVFASQQSFDSNIKSLFPHRIPIFFILFILKWGKFLADIYVWTSDGASIIHMLFLKSREGKYLTSKYGMFLFGIQKFDV